MATLMRAVAAGAVRVALEGEALGFALVRGVATSGRPKEHGPYVKREHVEGLHHLDRKLLEFLFDRVADSSAFTTDAIAAQMRLRPAEYWAALEEWRRSVRDAPRLAVGRAEARRLRREVSAVLVDAGANASAWATAASHAHVLGMDRALPAAARARARLDGRDLVGPAAVVALCALGSSRSTVLRRLDRLFVPWAPSKHLPAQYVGPGLPSWYRVRVIDDGSRRLGG
ncbi:MAG: hypothetical protein QMD96_01895 [Anaerosomatales bacterium]|nr:hypothetical protein [Anaerosomatales bacterium]